MRLLYFGDRHYWMTAPENRIDDYHETTKAKDLEIIELGRKYKVRAFLQPGDFWHKPNVPLEYATEIIKRWSNVDVFEALNALISNQEIDKKHLEQQLKNYIPIIGLAGNHELYGNNLSTLPKTVLGFMEKLGVMRFATKENPYFFYTEDGIKVAITGTHYHIDIDTPEHIDDYVVEEKLGDIHIHMVHGYLTDKSKGNLFRHTVIDQIKHTKADLTITGHDHIGFPITEIDGKYFVNPGAVVRLTNDLKEMNRVVKVLLIDITKEHGLRLKEIPLKSALKGDMVLSRKKIIERKKRETHIEEIKKIVRNANVKKSVDITEIVRNISDNQNLPVGVRDKVVGRISEKMKEMSGTEDITVKHAYVTKIVLENFQSHEYTELELSKGFNVFVGESGQGKTAVLRAFNWVYENKPTGKRIIRKGADYARVTIHLSNGYIISRYIEAKRGGKNGYEITNPNTGDIEFHNTKIVPEVQKILGYTTLNIDKDLQLNLNFMKQGQSWFLIGDKYSGQQRAKIIGGIYGTQYADAVIREIDSEIKRLNEKTKDSTESLLKTTERLKAFEYLPTLKQSIESIESGLREIKELKARKEKIEQLVHKHEQLTIKMQKTEKVLEELQTLDKVILSFQYMNEQILRRNQLENLFNRYKETARRLKNLYGALERLKDLDKMKTQIEEQKQLFERRNAIEKLTIKHQELTNQLQTQAVICQKTELIGKAKIITENLYKGLEIRNRLEVLNDKHESLVSRIHKVNAVIQHTEQIPEVQIWMKQLQEEMNRSKEIAVKAKRAEELELKRAKTTKSLKWIQYTIEKTAHLEEMKEAIATVQSLYERKQKIEQALQIRNQTLEAIAKEEKTIKETNEQIHQQIHVYQNLLENEGKCPVCYGTIDKATINRIVQELVH